MGVTIKDFENNLKDDLVRELILNVFQAPTKIDTTILEKSIAHYFQSRSVSFIELNANTFKNFSKKPTDSEISKYFEEYIRSSIEDLQEFKNSLKGELTVVISEKKIDQKKINKLSESNKDKIKKLIDKLSIKDIVDVIVEEKNVSKKEVYNYCLSLKNEN